MAEPGNADIRSPLRLHSLQNENEIQGWTRQPTAGAASTSEILLPLGSAYQSLRLYLSAAGTGMTEAEWRTSVDSIRIFIDSKLVREMTAIEAIDLFVSYYGDSRGRVMTNNGHLPIDFVPIGVRRNELGRRLVLGTEDLSTVMVQVNFLAGNVATNLQLYADRVRNSPCGPLLCYRRAPSIARASTGRQVLTARDIPLTPGSIITAIHVWTLGTSGSGAASLIEYTVNKAQKLYGQPAILNERLRSCGRAPVTGWAHLDFTAPYGDLEDAIPVSGDPARGHPHINEHELAITWTAAPTLFNVMVEQIEGIPSSR